MAFPLYSSSTTRLDLTRIGTRNDLFHYFIVPTQRGQGRHSMAVQNCGFVTHKAREESRITVTIVAGI